MTDLSRKVTNLASHIRNLVFEVANRASQEENLSTEAQNHGSEVTNIPPEVTYLSYEIENIFSEVANISHEVMLYFLWSNKSSLFEVNGSFLRYLSFFSDFSFADASNISCWVVNVNHFWRNEFYFNGKDIFWIIIKFKGALVLDVIMVMAEFW